MKVSNIPGVPSVTSEKIVELLVSHAKVTQCILYGSRATGTHRPGSDIDLVLDGENLTFDDILKIKHDLDNLNTPYKFDICDRKRISQPSLIEHINSVGITIFCRAE